MNFKTIVLLGDGECNEGTVWEAAMFASSKKLENLYVIVDQNGWQGIGRTKDILKSIPKGQYVEINHINGKKLKGTLLSFNKDRLFVQTPMSVKMIKMTSMERITYRDNIIDRPELQKFIYSGAAIMGLIMLELWNRQTNPIWAYRWHNRFFGATLGLLAGAELYDTSMIMMTKKTKFGLSASELKKLNRK